MSLHKNISIYFSKQFSGQKLLNETISITSNVEYSMFLRPSTHAEDCGVKEKLLYGHLM